MGANILVIEDEESIREYMCYLLNNCGFTTIDAANGEDGLRLLSEKCFDLIITDMALPLKDGVEIMTAARNIDARVGIIAVSGALSLKELMKNANSGGADAIIQKPFTENDFIKTVYNCLEKSADSQRENRNSAIRV